MMLTMTVEDKDESKIFNSNQRKYSKLTQLQNGASQNPLLDSTLSKVYQSDRDRLMSSTSSINNRNSVDDEEIDSSTHSGQLEITFDNLEDYNEDAKKKKKKVLHKTEI